MRPNQSSQSFEQARINSVSSASLSQPRFNRFTGALGIDEAQHKAAAE
jgi:hypothetical protein